MHIPTLFLLLGAPFLLGLNRPLAWTLWAILAVAALYRLPAVRPGSIETSPISLLGMPLLALAGSFALLVPFAQLAGGSCSGIPSILPCVTDTEASVRSLAFVLLLLIWTWLLLGPGRPRTEQALLALAVAGGAQATYALGCHYLGITPLFMGHAFHHADVPTGGFPNRNHLAAFLYICIFATIALILRLPGDTGSGRAGRWRLLLDQRLLWRLLVVVMVLALVATRSRAGNAGLLVGLGAGFAWLMLAERRGRGGKPAVSWRFASLLLASVVLLDTLFIGSFVGLDKVRQRLSDTAIASELRDDVNRVLLAHPELFTPLGHGASSFEPAFEAIKPASIPLHYNLAHNDYLQVLVERGWAGALLLMAALLLLARRALHRPASGRGAEVRFAWVAATAALMTHATVEFVTQTPALWMAWLALTALAVRAAADRRRAAAG